MNKDKYEAWQAAMNRYVELTGASLLAHGPLPSFAEMEAHHIRYVLETVDGNKTKAAAILGVDRRTLYRMMGRCGIPKRFGYAPGTPEPATVFKERQTYEQLTVNTEPSVHEIVI